MKENQKTGKLATYAVIMLLAAIIIIIIAAMADNREEKFQSQIDSTTRTNMTIQQEIVAIKDENYVLKQENDKLKKQLEENSAHNEICAVLSEAVTLFESDKPEEAKQKLAEIDSTVLSEQLVPVYNMAASIINEAN